MSDKIQKLKELVKLVDDSLTRSDFEAAFSSLIEFIKRTDKNLTSKIEGKMTEAEQQMEELEKHCKEMMGKIEDDNTSSLSNIKKWALEGVGKLFINSKINERLAAVDQKLQELDEIELPDVEAIALEASTMAYSEILPMIPTIEAIEADLPKLGEPIRDALELLEDGDKLAIEAIQDLEERLDELKRQIGLIGSRPTGGGGNQGNLIRYYDLSSSLDGVTKVFNVPSMYRIIAIIGSSFPSIFRPLVDYTYDSATSVLTFTDQVTAGGSLAAGQTITIIYGATG